MRKRTTTPLLVAICLLSSSCLTVIVHVSPREPSAAGDICDEDDTGGKCVECYSEQDCKHKKCCNKEYCSLLLRH
jgi:hypothetical protein